MTVAVRGRRERVGMRDLHYSRWHRDLPADLPALDVDFVEYCTCGRLLAVVETALDHGQADKPTTILARLAEQAGVEAWLVLYHVRGADGLTCAACGGSHRCGGEVVALRVRRVWPEPTLLVEVEPGEWAEMLRAMRCHHPAVRP